MTTRSANRIEKFAFPEGKIISKQYKIISLLGAGWEGEVYMIREIDTGIERAAKFFFPHRNLQNQTVRRYAKKLHTLRHCDILIRYHHQERVTFKGQVISCLISDFVEGDILGDILQRTRGKRLPTFEAVCLLHALIQGVEAIHAAGEYHGDLHTDNVFVQKYGINYKIKLIDLFHHKDSKSQNMHFDICNVIRIFYDCLGGAKHYANQPKEVKNIICGLRKSSILTKFRSAAKLRQHIESIQWDM